jgi:ribosomal protein L22
VEEYGIVESRVFERTRAVIRRFEDGNGAKRPPMPEDRKMAKIERIFNEYMASLKAEGEETQPSSRASQSCT